MAMEAALPSEIMEELKELYINLCARRKKRQISPGLASAEALQSYTLVSSHPLHETNEQGILAIDIHPSKDLLVSGGNDTNAIVFDRSAGQILAALTGHSKQVTSVKFVPRDDIVLTASADKTVRIWRGGEDGAYACKHTLEYHSAEVRAVSVHPTNNYFLSASSDKTWGFCDLNAGECLIQATLNEIEQGFTTASFHPDGLLFATGESVVRFWDMKSQKQVARFEGFDGPVTDMSFSENGYFFATSATDGVKLWDLRKLRSFRSYSITSTNTVQFDSSGIYLVIGASDIRLLQTGTVKHEGNLIKTLPGLPGSGKVTCARFGPDATYVATGNEDGRLGVLGAHPSADLVPELEAWKLNP